MCKLDSLLEPSFFKQNAMEPVVLALASNERYFPGLYCAVASALSHLTQEGKWI